MSPTLTEPRTVITLTADVDAFRQSLVRLARAVYAAERSVRRLNHALSHNPRLLHNGRKPTARRKARR